MTETSFDSRDFDDAIDDALHSFFDETSYGVEDLGNREDYTNFVEVAESFFETWFIERLPELYDYRALTDDEESELAELCYKFALRAMEAIHDHADQEATYSYLRRTL